MISDLVVKRLARSPRVQLRDHFQQQQFLICWGRLAQRKILIEELMSSGPARGVKINRSILLTKMTTNTT